MASCPSDPSANHPSHSRNEPITSPFPIVTTYNIVSQPSRHHQSMHFQFRSRCGLICITTADNPSVRRTKPPIYPHYIIHRIHGMKPSPMPFQSLILSQPSPIIFNSDPTVHGLIRITTADYSYCVRRTIQTTKPSISIRHPIPKRPPINQSYPSYQIHCDRVHQR
eukprot:640719_1